MSERTTEAETIPSVGSRIAAAADQLGRVADPSPGAPHGAGQGSLLTEAPGDGNPEVELVRKAAAILGVEQMVRWMKMQIPSLNNQTPLSLMATPEGRDEVERALGRIEHGVF